MAMVTLLALGDDGILRFKNNRSGQTWTVDFTSKLAQHFKVTLSEADLKVFQKHMPEQLEMDYFKRRYGGHEYGLFLTPSLECWINRSLNELGRLRLNGSTRLVYERWLRKDDGSLSCIKLCLVVNTWSRQCRYNILEDLRPYLVAAHTPITQDLVRQLTPRLPSSVTLEVGPSGHFQIPGEELARVLNALLAAPHFQ